MKEPTQELLMRWRRNCLRSQIANYKAANQFTKRNYFLGIPSILFSTFVGTSVFATLQQEKLNMYFQISLGLVSVGAALLASLQTFFKWGELAAKFKSAGVEYGALKRDIDALLALEKPIEESTITPIRLKMDTLSRDAPELPEKIWCQVRNELPTSSTNSIAEQENNA